ncbi:hypothetical protein V502_08705 [Pseudogymnoascus sp. VKM F-4520 (FW-2644)]|nr:hypothetical protein V502_08705 [Pseudogymnoascus sp. VKM F-4520 (FW-2644)]
MSQFANLVKSIKRNPARLKATTVLVPTKPGAPGLLPVYARHAQPARNGRPRRSHHPLLLPPKLAANRVPRLPRRPIDSLLPPLARPLPNPQLHQLGALDAPPPRAPPPHPTQQPRARLPRHRVPRRAARYFVHLDACDGVYAAHGCVWGAAYLWAGVLWRDCGVWNDGVSEGRGEDGE